MADDGGQQNQPPGAGGSPPDGAEPRADDGGPPRPRRRAGSGSRSRLAADPEEAWTTPRRSRRAMPRPPPSDPPRPPAGPPILRRALRRDPSDGPSTSDGPPPTRHWLRRAAAGAAPVLAAGPSPLLPTAAGKGRGPRLKRGAGRHSAPEGRIPLPRSPVVLTIIVVVLLLGAALVAVTLLRPHPASATPVAQSYLADWNRRDFTAMASLVEHPPPDFAATHQAVIDNLTVSSWQYRLGAVKTHGSRADAAFTAHISLAGLGTWDYPSTLHLAMVFGHWMVEWTPSAIYPTMPIGGHFSLLRSWPPRAQILGTGGTVLAGSSDVITVGLQGNAVSSPAEVTSALTQAGIDPVAIATALKTAAVHPTQFVAVADLSDARYQQVKPIIFRVPGTRFQRHSGQTTATPDLAAHVVGTVGPVTAQQLTQLGAPYEASDTVGQVGIEAQYERQLAGTPGGSVEVLGSNGTVIGNGPVFALPAKVAAPVQTTIDLHTEQAAEAALNNTKLPAALVAIRASTGEVLAAVSRPDNTSFDRALDGQYPPGSTFKVVTTSALLANGLTPNSPTTCPKTIAVEGRTFKNFEGESALDLTLERAFAVSCNTAFISMAGNLTGQQLITAAEQFGFGSTPKPGLVVFGGQIPPPVDEVDKVASAIGQGRVLASPLQMAGVAAAVDSGTVHAPRLVVGAPDDSAKAVPLSPGVVSGLRTLMAAVVASGTGTSANVSGGSTVYGKTGTAEFGNANPPMTHAWFIGFRDDVAFAVVVESGGVGGAVAAPIAAKFLRGL